MVSKGGYKRASMKGVAPVNRGYIERLLRKADRLEYKSQVGGGKYSPMEQKMRNKALISLLYLTARRISELIGRTYRTKKGKVLEWEGVKVSDFSIEKARTKERGEIEVLYVRTQILKKNKPYPADTVLSLGDEPFIGCILEWVEYLRENYGEDTKLFSINASRCFQILRQLDPKINNHWFRHMRLSHLAEFLNPYELTERIGYWETIAPAVSYVHGRLSTYLDAVEKTAKSAS